MQINPQTKITLLAPEFVSILNEQLENTVPGSDDVIALNFRDPNYSFENGGHHSVSIHAGSNGEIQCITDFAYFGVPPFIELGIELDWSFIDDGYFRQFDSMFDLECGRGLLGMYTSNFAAYYRSGVYEVEIATL